MRKFGFIIHPLSYDDVLRYEPKAAGKGMPLIRKILEWMPAYVVSEVTGVRSKTGEEILGYFIGVPLMPDQFLELPRTEVMARIIKGANIAAELGCGIVGLGGFTAVVGDGGPTVAENCPIAVTSGNSYTIAAAMQSLFRGAHEMEVDVPSASAVVIGATGSIGSACAQILANKVSHVTLAARNATRLAKLTHAMQPHVKAKLGWTTDIKDAVQHSELVLTATAATSSVVEPEDLKAGAVVCEVSLPHDVSRRVATERDDVLVTEGGNVRVPGEVDFHFDFGLPSQTSLACMAETMILTLENRFVNYSLGRGVNLDKVLEIERLAEKHGFEVAGMRAFDKEVTPEMIAHTRERARAARASIARPAGVALS
ncbi:MAG: SDR family NAD(P)-dependent oxidoreductase [Candidatus Eremiobacteraeota bacterium]|nr:SDR family NAD(P)-dependent oxidoreductase [Candidatus Eremiobacteraeota bacterium]